MSSGCFYGIQTAFFLGRGRELPKQKLSNIIQALGLASEALNLHVEALDFLN